MSKRAYSGECSVPGCGGFHDARGLCKSHYQRWRRHGDPLAGGTSNGEPLRFLEAALRHDGDQCLVWPYGRIGGRGYGVINVDGKKRVAHRVVCESVNGPAPTAEHQAAHNCGNASCVNPKHLRWATPKENCADKVMHGTHNRGARNGTAKLSERQVAAIRASTLPFRDIAQTFGVSPNTIARIASGKSWVSPERAGE